MSGEKPKARRRAPWDYLVLRPRDLDLALRGLWAPFSQAYDDLINAKPTYSLTEFGQDTIDLMDAVEGKAAHRDKVLAAWKAIALGDSPLDYAPFIRAVAEQIVRVEEEARKLSALPKGERKTPQALNSARIKNLGGCLGLGGTPDRYAPLREVIDAANIAAMFSVLPPDTDEGATDIDTDAGAIGADGPGGPWRLSTAKIKQVIQKHEHLWPHRGPDSPQTLDEVFKATLQSTQRGAPRKK